jgi:hypothetical protein
MPLPYLKPIQELALRKPHGTRLKYMAGCKCMQCRAANSRYETSRSRLRKQGLSNGIFSAKKAQRRILKLSYQGIGYKTVAKNAGVSRTVMFKIRSGQQTHIREMTEKRILELGARSSAAGQLIDAAGTWRKIKWLLGPTCGFSKTELARRLGSKAKTPSLQIRDDIILTRTARAVSRLYLEMMN